MNTLRKILAKYPVPIALTLGSLIILLFVGVAYFSGGIADFLLGEEYYVVGNAAVYSHVEAWVRYFLSNGRLIEGIYWTYLYELLDFSPAIFRLFSFGLVYLGALLGSISILRIWPNKDSRHLIGLLLLLLFFFGPFTLNWVNKLSGDNSRLAIVFFWAGVLCLQQWAISNFQRRPLFLALAFQLLSLFTYEVAAFLFPAGLLFTMPILLLKNQKTYKTWVKQFLLLGSVSFFFVFIPYGVYKLVDSLPGVFMAHYASDLVVADRVLGFFSSMWMFLVNLGNTEVVQRGLWAPLFFISIFLWVVLILKNQRSRRITYAPIFAGALWIFVFLAWLFGACLESTPPPRARMLQP